MKWLRYKRVSERQRGRKGERQRGKEGEVVGEEAIRGENTFCLPLAANFNGSGNCYAWSTIFVQLVFSSFFWRFLSKVPCLIVAAAILAAKSAF